MNIFSLGGSGPNPLTTEIGQLIDKATDLIGSETSVGLFFEICDLIEEKEENGKDAMRAIRKKMSIYNGKNWVILNNLLMLVETCANNCSKRCFQLLLANKDFLAELKAIIQPKLQPPLVIQEKILYLIQHWAAQFKTDPDFKPIEHCYMELKARGIEFPSSDKPPASMLDSLKASTTNANAIINIQPPQLPRQQQQQQQEQPQHQSHQQQQQQQQQFQRVAEGQLSGASVKLNEQQTSKLTSELDIVSTNVQVLNELLDQLSLSDSKKSAAATAVATTAADDEQLQLLGDLNKTCREMQKRVTQLIGNISNETIIGELLRTNDELNSVFLRYDRYAKAAGIVVNSTHAASPTSSASAAFATASANAHSGARSPTKSTSQAPIPRLSPPPRKEKYAAAAAAAANDFSLIDFNDDSANGAAAAASATPKSPTKTAAMSENRFEDIGLTEADADAKYFEGEINEIQQWLNSQGGGSSASNKRVPANDDPNASNAFK